MNYAVILSGGIGSRFWPLSSQRLPKQFLKVCSNKSMIEETIQRVSCLIRKKNIYIAANRIHSRVIQEYLRHLKLPRENFLFEPERKGTLAPIGVLSSLIAAGDRNAIIIVLPCDHRIRKKKRFISLVKEGISIASGGSIVVFGVTPTRPETGYGYVKVKRKKGKYYSIERFVEKPDASTAERFLKESRYYWNAGIFIFKATTMLEEIRRILPEVYEAFSRISKNRQLDRLWQEIPFLSIDHAVMEKARQLALIPAPVGWMDIGSWQALAEISEKDKSGNTFIGRHIDMDSKDSFLWSDNRLVATLGLEDIIVVNTKRALLVCRKDRAEEVKKLVHSLKRNNMLDEI